jgi:hypothetical protein
MADIALSASSSDYDPLTFTATGLPDGLTIDSSSGEISGVIADDAYSSTPYAVTDTTSAYDTQSFNWTVNPPIETLSACAFSISFNASAAPRPRPDVRRRPHAIPPPTVRESRASAARPRSLGLRPRARVLGQLLFRPES